jgi:hypothetical protein
VARAPWSTHPDGICHETFATPAISDWHWVKGVHTDPRTVERLRQDERGIWHSAKRRPTIATDATDGRTVAP